MNADDPVGEFKAWYNKQPVFTRTYLSIALALTVLVSISLLKSVYLYHTFDTTIGELQIWRPFTSVVFQGKFGFNFIFAMLIAHFALYRVEVELFSRDTYADFLWLMIYLFTGVTLFGLLIPIYFT